MSAEIEGPQGQPIKPPADRSAGRSFGWRRLPHYVVRLIPAADAERSIGPGPRADTRSGERGQDIDSAASPTRGGASWSLSRSQESARKVTPGGKRCAANLDIQGGSTALSPGADRRWFRDDPAR